MLGRLLFIALFYRFRLTCHLRGIAVMHVFICAHGKQLETPYSGVITDDRQRIVGAESTRKVLLLPGTVPQKWVG